MFGRARTRRTQPLAVARGGIGQKGHRKVSLGLIIPEHSHTQAHPLPTCGRAGAAPSRQAGKADFAGSEAARA